MNRGKKWSLEEDEYLLKNASSIPLPALATSLGRTERALFLRIAGKIVAQTNDPEKQKELCIQYKIDPIYLHRVEKKNQLSLPSLVETVPRGLETVPSGPEQKNDLLAVLIEIRDQLILLNKKTEECNIDVRNLAAGISKITTYMDLFNPDNKM